MCFKVQSVLLLVFISCLYTSADQSLKAVAVLKSNTVNGVIVFDQSADGSHVTVCINITGLTPEGNHGFHVHQYGDLREGCISAGPHFNPYNLTHGAPNDTMRHVGDLGNIVADSNGTVVTTLTDSLIKLSGQKSIIGRAVVVHATNDDLGKGTGDKAAESKKTGNAGGRVACAVIGIAQH